MISGQIAPLWSGTVGKATSKILTAKKDFHFDYHMARTPGHAMFGCHMVGNKCNGHKMTRRVVNSKPYQYILLFGVHAQVSFFLFQ